MFIGSLWGVPVGNPSAPSLLEEGFLTPDTFWSNFQFGFTQDFLLQKKMNESKICGNFQEVDLIWCIRERLNIQLMIGSGEIHYFGKHSDYGILWGGSAKCIVLEIKDTSIAIDAQAGGWDGRGSAISHSGRTHWDTRYYQGGVGVTQKWRWLAPYAGWNFNQTRFHIGPSIRLSQRFESGPIVGCTATNGSRFFLNAEWRGWFENALAVSGQIRF